jgi:hypothetical protein
MHYILLNCLSGHLLDRDADVTQSTTAVALERVIQRSVQAANHGMTSVEYETKFITFLYLEIVKM